MERPLPGAYGVHATFNVEDLSPYLDDDGVSKLRTIPFKGGGDDTIWSDSDGGDELVIDVEDHARHTHARRTMYLGEKTRSELGVTLVIGLDVDHVIY
ncbi:hypothetical protein OROGR_031090 [Orobanche gracilis]